MDSDSGDESEEMLLKQVRITGEITRAAENVLKQFPCVYPQAGFGSVVDVTGMKLCGNCVFCELRRAITP